MTLDIWYLFEHFRALPAAGKMAVIGGYILVFLLALLWARFLFRKQDAKTLSTDAQLPRHPTKDTHDCADNPEESGNFEKPKQDGIIRLGLFGKFPNNGSNWYLHYQTEDKRQDDKQHSLKPVIIRCSAHMHTILNKLQRRVNQSGKEPYGFLGRSGSCRLRDSLLRSNRSIGLASSKSVPLCVSLASRETPVLPSSSPGRSYQNSRLFSSAWPRVRSSAYSSSAPKGRPRARRVTRTPSGVMIRCRYMAIVSLSTLGLVATITSATEPSSRRARSSFTFRSSGPMPRVGLMVPWRT